MHPTWSPLYLMTVSLSLATSSQLASSSTAYTSSTASADCRDTPTIAGNCQE